MMGKMLKYVMFDTGVLQPILFTRFIQHRDVVNGMNLTPRSAGFVFLNDDGSIETYGESISLGLRPLPEDARLIEIYLRGDGD